MDTERFYAVMDKWAEDEREKAAKAEAEGDERGHSIALMCASMYENMLRVMAIKAPAKLASTVDVMAERAAQFDRLGDLDSAERCRIQIACIEKVAELIGGRAE